MEPRLLMLYKPLTASHEYIEKKLLELLRPEGRIISTRTWGASPDELLKELYAEHKDKSFFDSLWKLYSDKRLVANIFEAGEDNKNPAKWVNYMRDDVIGYKDPIKAKPGSFRSFVYEVTGDTIERVNRENRPMDNGVHLSDSVEAGIREGGIFFWDWPLNPTIVNNPEALKKDNPILEVAGMGKGIFLEERVAEYLLRNKLVDAETLNKVTSITECKGSGGKSLMLGVPETYDGADDAVEYPILF